MWQLYRFAENEYDRLPALAADLVGRQMTVIAALGGVPKVMRLTAQAAQFHAGSVHFREDAPWLGELMAELLGFPGVRHDDQVDSISQALAFINWRESHRTTAQPLGV